MARRNNPNKSKPQAKSPLLRLPAELRFMIYTKLLICPHAVRLGPEATPYAEQPSNPPASEQAPESQVSYRNPILRARAEKYRARENLESGADVYLAFRLQRDLEYVRREMGTGLLGTCRLVYAEATEMFWGGNVWSFALDDEWEVLTRFLFAIGKRARKRLRRVDVQPPWAVAPNNLGGVPEPYVKNHPKLRMPKVWKENGVERHPLILNLWESEGAPEVVNYVVPSTFVVSEPRPRGNRFMTVGYSKWMLLDFDFHYTKLRLTIEDCSNVRARLACDPEIYTNTGYEIHLQTGSWTEEDGRRRRVQEDIVILADEDCELLAGVATLLKHDEDETLFANNGKPVKSERRPKLARHLKAFGPCVLDFRDIYRMSCWRCRRYVSCNTWIGREYWNILEVREREWQEASRKWLDGFELW